VAEEGLGHRVAGDPLDGGTDRVAQGMRRDGGADVHLRIAWARSNNVLYRRRVIGSPRLI
jgi:hypothetical protein